MSTLNNGGPAFPSKKRIYRAGYPTDDFEPVGGMSLRDYFAAKAMQAFVRTLCDKDQMQDREAGDLIATLSYVQADAMINARKPTP